MGKINYITSTAEETDMQWASERVSEGTVWVLAAGLSQVCWRNRKLRNDCCCLFLHHWTSRPLVWNSVKTRKKEEKTQINTIHFVRVNIYLHAHPDDCVKMFNTTQVSRFWSFTFICCFEYACWEQMCSSVLQVWHSPCLPALFVV